MRQAGSTPCSSNALGAALQAATSSKFLMTIPNAENVPGESLQPAVQAVSKWKVSPFSALLQSNLKMERCPPPQNRKNSLIHLLWSPSAAPPARVPLKGCRAVGDRAGRADPEKWLLRGGGRRKLALRPFPGLASFFSPPWPPARFLSPLRAVERPRPPRTRGDPQLYPFRPPQPPLSRESRARRLPTRRLAFGAPGLAAGAPGPRRPPSPWGKAGAQLVSCN